jgi:hypothetical protein
VLIMGNRRQRVRIGQWTLGIVGVLMFIGGRVENRFGETDALASTVGFGMVIAAIALTVWYSSEQRAGRP